MNEIKQLEKSDGGESIITTTAPSHNKCPEYTYSHETTAAVILETACTYN